MFVGHLAVAFGAKRTAPRVPLGALVTAAFGLDLLWPVLLLAGVEHVRIDPGNTAFTPLAFDSYPWSHSLLTAGIWSVLAGALAWSNFKRIAGAAVVGAVVLSHWILDWITHRPDLPLWPDGPRAGLGLWNSVPGTLIVEGALFVIAFEMYRRAARPRGRAGIWAFWSLIVLTSAIWASGPFSPPPPSPQAVTYAALALWIFPIWAIWIDHTRRIDVRS